MTVFVCVHVCVSDNDPSSYTSLPDLRPRHVGSEVTSYGIEGISRVKSFGAFKREFKLDDVCDFVQTGVQVCMFVQDNKSTALLLRYSLFFFLSP